jgi:HD-like signal output (HDOD) protein
MPELRQGIDIMKQGPATRPDLNKILPLARLPGFPQSAIRLLELSKDPNNGPAECAVPIEIDPGLTVQVLRFVNSSYFGFASKISNIKLAVALVSVNTVTNFVLWNAVLSLIPKYRCGPFDLISLWQDSLRRALFARAFAKLIGVKDAENVFTAALLQDMAIPILARECPHAYVKLFESRQQGEGRLSSLEQRAFGWSHAMAAGMIARHWRLPEELATLIENHAAIVKFDGRLSERPDLVTVGLSALLPTVADSQWNEREQFDSYYDQIIPGNNPAAVELLDHTDKEFDSFAPIMRLPIPAKTLVERYKEESLLAT